MQTSCKKEFTTKSIMDMTTSNYHIIFTHLAGLILGELKDAHKGSLGELVVNTMGALNYPFSLTKSSFVNFSLTSWPIALGVLHFLYEMANMCAGDDDDDIDDFDNDEVEQLMEQSYQRIIDGKNSKNSSTKSIVTGCDLDFRSRSPN